MKKLLYVLTAALALASCQGIKEAQNSAVTVAMTADPDFDVNGSAHITLAVSAVQNTKVKVTLKVTDDVESGRKAIAEEHVKFSMNPATVLMNKESSSVRVTVAKAGLKKNAQLCVVMESAEGAKISSEASKVLISWTGDDMSESDNNDSPNYGSEDPSGDSEDTSQEPSDDPSQEPSEDASKDPSQDASVDPTPTAGWTVSYEGLQYIEFEDGAGDVEVIKATGHKGEPVYIFLEDEGFLDSFGGDISAMLEQAVEYYNYDLDDGYSVEELIFTEDPVETYFNKLSTGTYEAYMIGMDEDGNVSGKWSYCVITIEPREVNIVGDIQKVPSWTATYVGRGEQVFEDEEEEVTETYTYDMIEVNWTEDTYFWCDLYERDSIGSDEVEDVIIGFAEDAWEELDGYNSMFGGLFTMDITDILNDSEYNSIGFYNCELTTYDLFIAEFNEDGDPTGRYNICPVTITGEPLPEGYDDEDEEEWENYFSAPRKAGAGKAVKKPAVHKKVRTSAKPHIRSAR